MSQNTTRPALNLFWKATMLAFLYCLIASIANAQTKTISISTGHPSIALTLYDNGVGVECKIVNFNPSVKYDVSYTVDYEFVCGTSKKTLSDKGTVLANGEMISLSQLMPDCVDDNKKRTPNSVRNARLSNFNATPIQANSTANSNTGGNYNNNSTSSINSRPPANESVQELAEWQKKQSSTKTSQQQSQNNAQTTETTARQNRLNDLKTQQQTQQQANYEKVMAYEKERQQSMAKSRETVNAVTGVITDYIMQRAEEKRRKQEEEEIRLAEEYKERMEKHEREEAIKAKINNRKAVITEFPAKDIPLGSKEKALSIYYFIYAYNNTINNENGAIVYVSNVFEIGKYNDGTRAYTSTIANETANLTPFAEVLHGYYYTREEAEQLRQSFISLLQNTDVTINTVTYKGKPTALVSTKEVTKPQSKYGKTININDQNFAPAKINTAKPSELPREEQKKENSKYGKTIKID